VVKVHRKFDIFRFYVKFNVSLSMYFQNITRVYKKLLAYLTVHSDSVMMSREQISCLKHDISSVNKSGKPKLSSIQFTAIGYKTLNCYTL
jgi:hypothetical protein